MNTADLLRATGVPHRRTLYTWAKEGKIPAPDRIVDPATRRRLLDWPPEAATACRIRTGLEAPPTPPDRSAEVVELAGRLAAAEAERDLTLAWIFSRYLPISTHLRERPSTLQVSVQALRRFQEQYQLRCRLGPDGEFCLDSRPIAEAAA